MLVVPSARRQGGGDIWLDQLLRKIGPTMSPVVVFQVPGELASAALGYGCQVETLGVSDDGSELAIASLAKRLTPILTTHQPAVTVFWSPRAQIYGAIARQLAALGGRSAWVQHVLPSDFWLHQAAAAFPTDAVLCVSHAVAERHRVLYPAQVTRVVHPGVDLGVPSLDRANARAVLGVDTSWPVVGLVGRIEPWKGQDVAIRAAAHLKARGLLVRLLLVGEAVSPTWPAYHNVVQALINDLDAADVVTLVGHRTDVTMLLPAFDVLVCASREEGFGLAVVEAMAAGVPVVSARCGGPQDIVEHGRTGLLVELDDFIGLADAIEAVLNKPSLAVRLATQARATYTERFTAAQSARAFSRVIEELSTA